MEHVASLFSLLFFLGALISLYWGLFIIKLNPESDINRKFLLLCIALGVWSFGMAMANSQSGIEDALFWRRFSAVGWTSMLSLVLHFFILISNNYENSKENKNLSLVHIPALINMYVFALSNNMSAIQYDLVKIDYGWTNLAVNNGWDMFYYLYYVTYVMFSIVVVWKWKNKLAPGVKLRQAKIILVAVAFAAFAGGFTDLLANSYFEQALPQMAPLFILIPVWAMYYSARYHNLLNIKEYKLDETILSTQQQKKLFTNFSIWIFVSGILSFSFEYFSSTSTNFGDLNASLIKGGFVSSVGVIMFLIQKIKDNSLRDKLTTVILVTSVPVITFQFLNYSTVTVWAYSMVIIISSLLFSKRTLLISTTLVALITQRLVWIFREDSYVLIDQYDFILRMFLLVVAFSLGSYINKVYIAKIKENDYQIAFQKLVSDVSFDFLYFEPGNSNDKIDALLAKIGKFFDVDRTYLFTLNYTDQTMTYSNEWCKSGIVQEVGTINQMPFDAFPWWRQELIKNHLVNISDVKLMPQEARAEQAQLQRQGVKSLVSVPVIGKGKIYAFIGMDSVLEHKTWSSENIELLNILANILASVLTPVQIDKRTKFMAYNDGLTLLPNRFLFADRLDQSISLAKRTQKCLAVIFIDLDDFKAVNDTIGHKGGDILLEQVARSLEGLIGATDTVARFGGDEFLIMINSIEDCDEITKVAENIMNIFSDAITINGQVFFVTASAGIAVYPQDGENSESLVKNADMAMYKAKGKGKNQFLFVTEEMKNEMALNRELSSDLSGALDRNEFILYYQPQIDLSTNKISGLEALLRWVHPSKGMIPPGVFIPLAERNNLISDIGQWVLKEACQQNKKWQDMDFPAMDIAVNLSAAEITNPNTANHIERIIQQTGLNPKYLGIEVTESIAIKETDYVLNVLNNLKKTGVTIAIDDFGTEYSSLYRLKQLPIDQIKIDLQFVQGIETNEKDRAIIKTIISLAKNLGLSVLAEGVETLEQLEFLRKNQCDFVQGYYFYKPMSAKDVEETLRNI